jgi:hypothetical protein
MDAHSAELEKLRRQFETQLTQERVKFETQVSEMSG